MLSRGLELMKKAFSDSIGRRCTSRSLSPPAPLREENKNQNTEIAREAYIDDREIDTRYSWSGATSVQIYFQNYEKQDTTTRLHADAVAVTDSSRKGSIGRRPSSLNAALLRIAPHSSSQLSFFLRIRFLHSQLDLVLHIRKKK